MPKIEQFGFGNSGAKPENPDAERRIELAKKAGLRRQGIEARGSLQRAFEEEGLDKEESLEGDQKKEKVAA